MALPSFHRQAPLESTLSRALGKAGIDSKGGEDSFKTNFFFSISICWGVWMLGLFYGWGAG